MYGVKTGVRNYGESVQEYKEKKRIQKIRERINLRRAIEKGMFYHQDRDLKQRRWELQLKRDDFESKNSSIITKIKRKINSRHKTKLEEEREKIEKEKLDIDRLEKQYRSEFFKEVIKSVETRVRKEFEEKKREAEYQAKIKANEVERAMRGYSDSYEGPIEPIVSELLEIAQKYNEFDKNKPQILQALGELNESFDDFIEMLDNLGPHAKIRRKMRSDMGSDGDAFGFGKYQTEVLQKLVESDFHIYSITEPKTYKFGINLIPDLLLRHTKGGWGREVNTYIDDFYSKLHRRRNWKPSNTIKKLQSTLDNLKLVAEEAGTHQSTIYENKTMALGIPTNIKASKEKKYNYKIISDGLGNYVWDGIGEINTESEKYSDILTSLAEEIGEDTNIILEVMPTFQVGNNEPERHGTFTYISKGAEVRKEDTSSAINEGFRKLVENHIGVEEGYGGFVMEAGEVGNRTVYVNSNIVTQNLKNSNSESENCISSMSITTRPESADFARRYVEIFSNAKLLEVKTKGLDKTSKGDYIGFYDYNTGEMDTDNFDKFGVLAEVGSTYQNIQKKIEGVEGLEFSVGNSRYIFSQSETDKKVMELYITHSIMT